MPSETPISLQEDDELPKTTNNQEQGLKKKLKSQNHKEMNKIINVLENSVGLSMKECMKILRRLMNYKHSLYCDAINSFCKRK